FSLGASYLLDSNKVLSVEAATSRYDPNLYSSINDHLHWGYASKINYSDTRYLGKTDSLSRKPWSWNNQVNYEYVGDQFKAIAPYRNIEFNRDWSVDTTLDNQNQQLVTFQSWLQYRK